MKNYEVIPIGKNAWCIQEKNVRCFLFAGNSKALLIDSGMEISFLLEKIINNLTQLPVILANTHADYDHTSGNGAFKEVYMHPAEYTFFHHGGERHQGLMPLWDGDIIDLGDRQFRAIHTPGHTPGSSVFLNEEERFLVGGDGIQNGTIYMYGTGRDILAYQHSLKRIYYSIGKKIDTIYASHADLQVSVSIIPLLIDGVNRILAGQVTGKPNFPEDDTVLEYDIGVAKFLCRPQEIF